MSGLESMLYNLVREAVRDVIIEEAKKGTFKQYDQPRPQSVQLDKKISKERDPLSIVRTKELAENLSVSATTLYRMTKEGRLPPRVKLSNRLVGWRYGDIKKWLEDNQV